MPRGRPPAWLESASDVRFVGLSGDDDTVLHFEVPSLGEAAECIYQQKEFWDTRPDPEDTGLDLLGDVICVAQSTEAFAIMLDDQQEVCGIIASGQIDNLSELWQERVLVLGTAIYRPSGALLRVDAEQITLAENKSSFWSRMPEPNRRTPDKSSFRKAQTSKTRLGAIVGKWPGDETDEEIEEALRKLLVTIPAGQLIVLEDCRNGNDNEFRTSHTRYGFRLDEPNASYRGDSYGRRMSNTTQQIVNKAWNFAHVLRDDGLSYMAYTEQITFLLFLKMADEQTKPPYNRRPVMPAKFSWESLVKLDGEVRWIRSGVDSLASDPGKRYSVVLTNPPFGKKSSIAIVNEEGDLEKEASDLLSVLASLGAGLLTSL